MKPTPEQLEATSGLLRDLCCHPSSATCSCNYMATSADAWAHIAPMVLEAAARECEAMAGEHWPDDKERWITLYATKAARRIRTLKQTG